MQEILEQDFLHKVPNNPNRVKFKRVGSNNVVEEMDKLGMSDRALLDLFDKKLSNLKNSMKNLVQDFSTWQTSLADKSRFIRDIDARVTELEN